MAYSTITHLITEPAIIALNADKPAFVGKNYLEQYLLEPQWRRSGNWSTGTNDTAAGFDARRVVDNFADIPTKPSSFATTTYSVIFDLYSEAPYENLIEVIAILGHNFDDLPGEITVYVDIANSADFVTNYLRIATFTDAGADDIRLVKMLANSYANVRFIRVVIETDDTFVSDDVVPEIGEIVAGPRLQMGSRPNQPWSDKVIRGDIAKARTKGGSTTRYERNVNGVVLTPNWSPILGTDPFTGTNDETTLWTLFQNIEGGNKSFLFIDQPSTVPRKAYFCDWQDPNFDIVVPAGRVDQGEFNATFVEQAPFYWDEAAI